MSVLIKSMEMPTSCAVCPFENYGDCYGGKVKAIMDIDDYVSAGKRHPRCPLVPVPKHRRLIDADDAYHILTNYYHHSTELQHYELREALARVSTVIPAEERPAEDTNAPTTYDLLYEEGGLDTR